MVAVYPVTADPPSEAGGDQVAVTDAAVWVSASAVGAVGAVLLGGAPAAAMSPTYQSRVAAADPTTAIPAERVLR